MKSQKTFDIPQSNRGFIRSKMLSPDVLAVERAEGFIVFPDGHTMKLSPAELADEPAPCETRYIFDGGIVPSEIVNIEIKILMIDDFNQLIVHNFLEIADMKTFPAVGDFYRYFDDIIVSVTCRIRALAENLQIFFFGKILVPELVRRRKLEFLTEINHLNIL